VITATEIKAIQTRYKGYHFRSRLEARWAVFFDEMGYRWEYEPQGYDLGAEGLYLPDFFLPDHRMFAEVKPLSSDVKTDCKKIHALGVQSRMAGVLLRGSPRPTLFYCAAWFPYAKNGKLDMLITMDLDDDNTCGRFPRIDANYAALMYKYEPQNFLKLAEPVSVKLQHAIDAARSARFEHGESGATL
jgi:hypothetical protein